MSLDLSVSIDAMNTVKRQLTLLTADGHTEEDRALAAVLFDEAHELQEKLLEASGSRLSRNPPEPA